MDRASLGTAEQNIWRVGDEPKSRGRRTPCGHTAPDTCARERVSGILIVPSLLQLYVLRDSVTCTTCAHEHDMVYVVHMLPVLVIVNKT